MPKSRVHLIIEGRVQGVWFRESTRQEAVSLGVTGWVRNRRGGTVEVVAEGAEERVKKLVLWCHKGPPAATVLAVHETLDKWKGGFTSFEIVF